MKRFDASVLFVTCQFWAYFGQLLAGVPSLDPCQRQPFISTCANPDGTTTRSQFVLRYYKRNDECVSYPYGHCRKNPDEPELFKYKDECEKSCGAPSSINAGPLSPPPNSTNKPAESTLADVTEVLPVRSIEPVWQRPSASHGWSALGVTSTSTVSVTVPIDKSQSGSTSTVTVATSTLTSKHTVQRSQPISSTVATLLSTTTDVFDVTDNGEDNSESTPIPTVISDDRTPASAVSSVNQNSITQAASQITTTVAIPISTDGAAQEGGSFLDLLPGASSKCLQQRQAALARQKGETVSNDSANAAPAVTISGGFVPKCTSSGSFEQVQCDSASSSCWCVDADEGLELPGTRIPTARGQPDCLTGLMLHGSPILDLTLVRDPTGKAGVCPAPTAGELGVCVRECRKDNDCPGATKCCYNGCGRLCLYPHDSTNAGSNVAQPPSSPQPTPKPLPQCDGAADSGPCNPATPLVRWYYDPGTRACQTFNYGGCGGNGNNYETKKECETRCAPQETSLCGSSAEPLEDKRGRLFNCLNQTCPQGWKCSFTTTKAVCCPDDGNNKSAAPLVNDICRLPKDRGACDKYELRFYYNGEVNECKYFFFGGCGGNENNFKELAECQRVCGKQSPMPPDSQPPVVAGPPNGVGTTATITTAGESSVADSQFPNFDLIPTNPPTPPVQASVQTAVIFPPSSPPPISVASPTPAQPLPSPVPKSESTSAETQSSPGAVQSTVSNSVLPNVFQGTAATELSDAAVESVSSPTPLPAAPPAPKNQIEPQAPGVQPPGEQRPQLIAPEQPQSGPVLNPGDRCHHPKDSGPCSGRFSRWYWDPSKKACETFTYSGCQGNGNNFGSKDECLSACRELPADVCQHPRDRGECPATFHRFSYDFTDDTCKEFVYGGCGGNGNNFGSLIDCELKCKKNRLDIQHQIFCPRIECGPDCVLITRNTGCQECACPDYGNEEEPPRPINDGVNPGGVTTQSVTIIDFTELLTNAPNNSVTTIFGTTGITNTDTLITTTYEPILSAGFPTLSTLTHFLKVSSTDTSSQNDTSKQRCPPVLCPLNCHFVPDVITRCLICNCTATQPDGASDIGPVAISGKFNPISPLSSSRAQNSKSAVQRPDSKSSVSIINGSECPDISNLCPPRCIVPSGFRQCRICVCSSNANATKAPIKSAPKNLFQAPEDSTLSTKSTSQETGKIDFTVPSSFCGPVGDCHGGCSLALDSNGCIICRCPNASDTLTTSTSSVLVTQKSSFAQGAPSPPASPAAPGTAPSDSQHAINSALPSGQASPTSRVISVASLVPGGPQNSTDSVAGAPSLLPSQNSISNLSGHPETINGVTPPHPLQSETLLPIPLPNGAAPPSVGTTVHNVPAQPVFNLPAAPSASGLLNIPLPGGLNDAGVDSTDGGFPPSIRPPWVGPAAGQRPSVPSPAETYTPAPPSQANLLVPAPPPPGPAPVISAAAAALYPIPPAPASSSVPAVPAPSATLPTVGTPPVVAPIAPAPSTVPTPAQPPAAVPLPPSPPPPPATAALGAAAQQLLAQYAAAPSTLPSPSSSIPPSAATPPPPGPPLPPITAALPAGQYAASPPPPVSQASLGPSSHEVKPPSATPPSSVPTIPAQPVPTVLPESSPNPQYPPSGQALQTSLPIAPPPQPQPASLPPTPAPVSPPAERPLPPAIPPIAPPPPVLPTAPPGSGATPAPPAQNPAACQEISTCAVGCQLTDDDVGCPTCECSPLPLNVCLHTKDTGPCKAAFARAWYDISDNTCKQFIYGGCAGNGNNFATIAECEEMCIGKPSAAQPSGSPPAAVLPIPPTFSVTQSPPVPQAPSGSSPGVPQPPGPVQPNPQSQGGASGEAEDKCSQPLDPGPCNGPFEKRWWYNSENGQCESFMYGGCAGNRNHFYSISECEIHCARFAKKKGGATPSSGSPSSPGKEPHPPSATPPIPEPPAGPAAIGAPRPPAPGGEPPAATPQPPALPPIAPPPPLLPSPPAPSPASGPSPAQQPTSQQPPQPPAGQPGAPQPPGPQSPGPQIPTPQPAPLQPPAPETPPSQPAAQPPSGETPSGPALPPQPPSPPSPPSPPAGGNPPQPPSSVSGEGIQGSGGQPPIPAAQPPTQSGPPSGTGPQPPQPPSPPAPPSPPGPSGNLLTSPRPALTALPKLKSVIRLQASGKQTRCALPKDAGPCYAYLPRWYYDQIGRSCRAFVYGGCGGNTNLFPTKDDCDRACSIRPPSQQGGYGYQPSPDSGYGQPGPSPSYGGQSPSYGAPAPSYGGPSPSYGGPSPGYGGDSGGYQGQPSDGSYGGNQGNYGSDSGNYGQSNDGYGGQPSSGYGQQGGGNDGGYGQSGTPACPNGQSAASYPNGQPVQCLPGADDGGGGGTYGGGPSPGGYNNPASPASYGGGGGYRTRRARFIRQLGVLSSYLNNGADLGNQQNLANDIAPNEFNDAPQPKPYCRLPKDVGPCKGSHLRYYYDSQTGTCNLFYYSGCKGNKNNFATEEHCQVECHARPRAQAFCPGHIPPLGGANPVICGSSISCPEGYACQENLCCIQPKITSAALTPGAPGLLPLTPGIQAKISEKPEFFNKPISPPSFGPPFARVKRGNFGNINTQDITQQRVIADQFNGPPTRPNNANVPVPPLWEDSTEYIEPNKHAVVPPTVGSINNLRSPVTPSRDRVFGSPTLPGDKTSLNLNSCPDGSDPLRLSTGEIQKCGAGFDGVALCPKGYYCKIDIEERTRMCCSLGAPTEKDQSQDNAQDAKPYAIRSKREAPGQMFINRIKRGNSKNRDSCNGGGCRLQGGPQAGFSGIGGPPAFLPPGVQGGGFNGGGAGLGGPPGFFPPGVQGGGGISSAGGGSVFGSPTVGGFPPSVGGGCGGGGCSGNGNIGSGSSYGGGGPGQGIGGGNNVFGPPTVGGFGGGCSGSGCGGVGGGSGGSYGSPNKGRDLCSGGGCQLQGGPNAFGGLGGSGIGGPPSFLPPGVQSTGIGPGGGGLGGSGAVFGPPALTGFQPPSAGGGCGAGGCGSGNSGVGNGNGYGGGSNSYGGGNKKKDLCDGNGCKLQGGPLAAGNFGPPSFLPPGVQGGGLGAAGLSGLGGPPAFLPPGAQGGGLTSGGSGIFGQPSLSNGFQPPSTGSFSGGAGSFLPPGPQGSSGGIFGQPSLPTGFQPPSTGCGSSGCGSDAGSGGYGGGKKGKKDLCNGGGCRLQGGPLSGLGGFGPPSFLPPGAGLGAGTGFGAQSAGGIGGPPGFFPPGVQSGNGIQPGGGIQPVGSGVFGPPSVGGVLGGQGCGNGGCGGQGSGSYGGKKKGDRCDGGGCRLQGGPLAGAFGGIGGPPAFLPPGVQQNGAGAFGAPIGGGLGAAGFGGPPGFLPPGQGGGGLSNGGDALFGPPSVIQPGGCNGGGCGGQPSGGTYGGRGKSRCGAGGCQLQGGPLAAGIGGGIGGPPAFLPPGAGAGAPFKAQAVQKSSAEVLQLSSPQNLTRKALLESICTLPSSEGRDCGPQDKPSPSSLQYFYSTEDKRCKLFFYKGCGGNENSFSSRGECVKMCQGKEATPSTASPNETR